MCSDIMLSKFIAIFNLTHTEECDFSRFYPCLPTQGHDSKVFPVFILLSVFLFLLDYFHQQSSVLFILLMGKETSHLANFLIWYLTQVSFLLLQQLLKALYLFANSSFELWLNIGGHHCTQIACLSHQ